MIAFSKKTGDYASLSATDLKVLALTWAIEKEVNGSVDHLRTEPGRPVAQVGKHSPLSGAKKDAGMDADPEHTSDQPESTIEEPVKALEEPLKDLSLDVKETDPSIKAIDAPVETSGQEAETAENINDDDDDEGWITPSNVARKKKAHQARMLGAAAPKDGEEPKTLPVACMTTDFAMQVRF